MTQAHCPACGAVTATPTTVDEAKRQALKEAYNAERERWITEHGSAHLRDLQAEGITLNQTYLDERLAAERPGWSFLGDIVHGEETAIRDASPGDIAKLRQVRATFQSVKLGWLKRSVHGREVQGPALFDDFFCHRIVLVDVP